MRILAIDIGTKRIGLALSDKFEITASAYSVIESSNPESDLLEIKKIIKKENVQEIIVGVPFSLQGAENSQAKSALDFIDFLQKNLSIPVKKWDERLSTVEAEKVLIDADISRKNRKKVIDKITAAIILDSYLKYKRIKKGIE